MLIFGILIDDGTIKEIGIEDKLQAYCNTIGCSTIDIVKRRIGGEYYSIVCDDEGLFKEDTFTSMVWDDCGLPMLVGRLFICRDGGDGKLANLNVADSYRIHEHFKDGVVWGNI